MHSYYELRSGFHKSFLFLTAKYSEFCLKCECVCIAIRETILSNQKGKITILFLTSALAFHFRCVYCLSCANALFVPSSLTNARQSLGSSWTFFIRNEFNWIEIGRCYSKHVFVCNASFAKCCVRCVCLPAYRAISTTVLFREVPKRTEDGDDEERREKKLAVFR